MALTRRDFLIGAAAAGGVAATGALGSMGRALAASTAAGSALPSPQHSGIEHIVVVCMENRSFDHFLGWVPNADGRQAGLEYPDDSGKLHPTHHLEDWSGCGFNDPDHSYAGGRTQLDHGKLDGFRRGSNDDFALGYYTEGDLPLTSSVVKSFTICDRYFCGILGPTYPNRFYTHAAQTDRIDNTTTQSSLPTIWDRLSAAGVSANYYFSDLPFLSLWGEKYVPISRPFETFFAQAASGTLPAYSYIDPFFVGEGQGGSNDDHPHADIRRGQALQSKIINAVIQSPAWSNTVLVITYDEWGGFFEHVRPPVLPDNDRAHAQAGFRVPCYVISPLSRPGVVNHVQFDHTSILKMVEWRFGLAPLTRRDRAANNLALALDFSYRNKTTAVTDVTDPGPHICGAPDVGMPNSDAFWEELAASPLMRGWSSVR